MRIQAAILWEAAQPLSVEPVELDAPGPDEVLVEEIDEDGTMVLELEVAEQDMGRVIGKSGKVARAMRNLLQVAGGKLNRRYELEILE